MFFSAKVVPALVLALSLIDHAVPQAIVTVSPELAKICIRTTRTTTSRTTIIAPACPTATVTKPVFIGCPVRVCPAIACPLDESEQVVPVGCPTRCCPIKTPTVTVLPTCGNCGCPPGPIRYSVQNCPLDAAV